MRDTASKMIQAHETTIRPASASDETFSILPCPYVWSSSAGLSETWTEKKVSAAPARSSAECAASDSTPNEPENSPAASLSSVMAAAASMEWRATRRFSAEKPWQARYGRGHRVSRLQAGARRCTTLQCQRYRAATHSLCIRLCA